MENYYSIDGASSCVKNSDSMAMTIAQVLVMISY